MVAPRRRRCAKLFFPKKPGCDPCGHWSLAGPCPTSSGVVESADAPGAPMPEDDGWPRPLPMSYEVEAAPKAAAAEAAAAVPWAEPSESLDAAGVTFPSCCPPCPPPAAPKEEARNWPERPMIFWKMLSACSAAPVTAASVAGEEGVVVVVVVPPPLPALPALPASTCAVVPGCACLCVCCCGWGWG